MKRERERERERCVLYDDNESRRKWMNFDFFRFAVSFLFWLKIDTRFCLLSSTSSNRRGEVKKYKIKRFGNETNTRVKHHSKYCCQQ